MKFKLLIISLLCFSLFGKEPEALYLTWEGDPQTTMDIFWLVRDHSFQAIEYQKVGEEGWVPVKGVSEKLDPASIWAYRVHLADLQPDTSYHFRFGEKEPVHLFKTLSAGNAKVVIGGDAFLKEKLFVKMNRTVAAMGPDFVIMGGDIAYTEGLRHALKSRDWQPDHWVEFFRLWNRDMITPDGRMIPIVPVLGNHDVREGYDDPSKRPVLLYQVFAFEGGKSYRTLKAGDALFFLLDSGHLAPIGGEQAKWLENALKVDALYKFPVYHIAGYPTVYSLDHKGSSDIRRIWIPLFEAAGVRVVFENDNHAFKRTYALKGGKVDPEGIIYLGDGSWGVPPRKPNKRWYLEKAQKINCVWLLKISPEVCVCEAFDEQGIFIDRLEVSPAAVSSAQ